MSEPMISTWEDRDVRAVDSNLEKALLERRVRVCEEIKEA